MRARPLLLAFVGWAALAVAARGEEKPSAEERKALAAAEREARKEHDEAVKKAIDEFKKALRGARTDNDQAAALLQLAGAERDAKIIATVAPYLSAGGTLTRSEAVATIRVYRKDRIAAATLIAALPANKNMESVFERILSALGAVGHESVLPILLDHLKDRDTKVAVAAANGLGETNAVSVVEPLLDLLKRLEKESKGGGINIAGGGNEGQDRHRAISPAILDAFHKLTGQKCKDHAECEEWWLKNKPLVKPKPEDPFAGTCPVHQPKLKKGDRLVPMAPMGGLLREFWRNIPGGTVKDLTGNTQYAGPPSMKTQVASFEVPAKMGSKYGQRLRGYLYPPADGEYVFAVACDDAGELWLSTDDDPANKVLLCKVDKAIGQRDFASAEASSPVTLKAGKVYYVEGLHKQAEQGDHFAAGWKVPGGTEFIVVPGSCLSPFAPAGP